MRLLDDFQFDEHMRYEAHELHYTHEDGIERVFQGILAAAVLCALLADTDEGDARGIVLHSPADYDSFYLQYEAETRIHNGGLLPSETRMLNESYIQLIDDDDVLLTLCRNIRIYDLAVDITISYMHRLVHEVVGDKIYDALPFYEPFAQWLYEAGFVETRRQRLLSIDWSEPSEVYTLSQILDDELTIDDVPTFVFSGLAAKDLMDDYHVWLWSSIMQQISEEPEGNLRLAKIRDTVRTNELDWDFIRPKIAKLPVEQINQWNGWTREWKSFIADKLPQSETANHPRTTPSGIELELEPYSYSTQLPAPDTYTEVCEYIQERYNHDPKFKEQCHVHTKKWLAEQLTMVFGWVIDPNALRTRLNKRFSDGKMDVF